MPLIKLQSIHLTVNTPNILIMYVFLKVWQDGRHLFDKIQERRSKYNIFYFAIAFPSVNVMS